MRERERERGDLTTVDHSCQKIAKVFDNCFSFRLSTSKNNKLSWKTAKLATLLFTDRKG